MIFEQIKTGGDRNFAYLVGDKKSGQAAIADPSYNPDMALELAAEHGLVVKYLINTHDHSDHTNGNDSIITKTNAQLINSKTVDGTIIAMGETRLKVIHTPGHTPDCICILVTAPDEVPKLITGDTLFVGKVGGTGYGEDAQAEYDSLHQKLMTLEPETEVWPGHDYGTAPSSTIGHEKESNPFILQQSFEDFIDLKRNWAEYKQKHGIK
jgi:hydroxyacylglutathione hydrolase